MTRFIIHAAYPPGYSKKSPHPLASLLRLRLRISKAGISNRIRNEEICNVVTRFPNPGLRERRTGVRLAEVVLF
jgi:hypothetical protein